DIISTEKPGTTYNYLIGTSTGSGFTWGATNLLNLNEPRQMDLGDITGDGKADIVSAEQSGSSYNYVRGLSNGGGNFHWGGTNLLGFFEPKKMALGDINGDGKADIVSVEQSGSSYNYVRGLSQGNGNFTWGGTNLLGFFEPKKMDVGDINGDGKAD